MPIPLIRVFPRDLVLPPVSLIEQVFAAREIDVVPWNRGLANQREGEATSFIDTGVPPRTPLNASQNKYNIHFGVADTRNREFAE